MGIDGLIKPLMALPLFSGLPHEQLAEIVRAADRVAYRMGSVIAAENTPSDASIIIISGACVRLNDESGSFHGEALPIGSMISELGMLVEVEHQSTIMARDNVRVLRITRSQMLSLMARVPELADHFTQRLVDRLKDVADELSAIDATLERTSAASRPMLPGMVTGATIHAP